MPLSSMFQTDQPLLGTTVPSMMTKQLDVVQKMLGKDWPEVHKQLNSHTITAHRQLGTQELITLKI